MKIPTISAVTLIIILTALHIAGHIPGEIPAYGSLFLIVGLGVTAYIRHKLKG